MTHTQGMGFLKSRKRQFLMLVAAGALAVTAVVPAMAQNEVTQEVTGGSLTSSIENQTLTSTAYSHADQDSSGTLALTADDSTGTGDGWHVNVSAGTFTGTNDVTNEIAPEQLALTSAAEPVMTAGQAVSETAGEGPEAITTTGTLDTARNVIEAGVDFGKGTYTQDLGVTLTIPGQTNADSYTSTLTVEAVSGPEVN